MEFVIDTMTGAEEALRFFNHFHDSFIKSVVLEMNPRDGAEIDFGVDLKYDAKIMLLHSNYKNAKNEKGGEPLVLFVLSDLLEMNIGNLIPVDTMLGACKLRIGSDKVIHVDFGGDGLMFFGCKKLLIREL